MWELVATAEPPDETASLIPASVSATVGHPLAVGHLHHAHGLVGVIHGLRYSPLPTPADWAYLTCSRGEVQVVVADVRVGSPTFGRHRSIRLRAPHDATGTTDRTETTASAASTATALYVGPGLAHGYTALADDSVLTHLGPRGRRPEKDRTVHPLDPTLRLPWPSTGTAGTETARTAAAPTLPPETADAPLLADLRKAGRLPTYAAWRELTTRRT